MFCKQHKKVLFANKAFSLKKSIRRKNMSVKIDFNNLTEAIPAYLCLIAMPLMYSIAEGIAIGVISYVIINLICGKAKKITPLMYVLAVLFVCKYIFL